MVPFCIQWVMKRQRLSRSGNVLSLSHSTHLPLGWPRPQDISTVLSSYYREGGLHHLCFEECDVPEMILGRAGVPKCSQDVCYKVFMVKHGYTDGSLLIWIYHYSNFFLFDFTDIVDIWETKLTKRLWFRFPSDSLQWSETSFFLYLFTSMQSWSHLDGWQGQGLK